LSKQSRGATIDLMNTWFRGIGAVVTTLVVFAILIWTLAYVFPNIGVAAQLDKDGKVVLDKFGNIKSILLVVLPLASTTIGYWLGTQGTTQAQTSADQARTDAVKATAQASSATAQLTALADLAPAGTLQAAKEAHPEAFAPVVVPPAPQAALPFKLWDLLGRS
jgi:hypothetical protein